MINTDLGARVFAPNVQDKHRRDEHQRHHQDRDGADLGYNIRMIKIKTKNLNAGRVLSVELPHVTGAQLTTADWSAAAARRFLLLAKKKKVKVK